MHAPDRPERPPLDTPTPPGPTPFLVGAAGTAATVEALRASVAALIRERDYLRRVREVQLAEHQTELEQQRARVVEVQGELDALATDRDHWKHRAESALEDLADYRAQLVQHVHQLSAQRLRTAVLLREGPARRSRG